jgi:hypothetical protein
VSAPSKSSKSIEWDIPGLNTSPTKEGWPRTKRQLEFLKHYVMAGDGIELSATKAGYSATYARKLAYQLPGRLAECISWLRGFKDNIMEEKLAVSAELTLGEVAALAMLNWQDYLVPVAMHDGTTMMYGKPISELAPIQARGIKRFAMRTLFPFVEGVEVRQPAAIAGDVPIVVYDYELLDRDMNLGRLAEHFNLFHKSKVLEATSGERGLSFRDIPTPRLERFLEEVDALFKKDDRDAIDGEFSSQPNGRALM